MLAIQENKGFDFLNFGSNSMQDLYASCGLSVLLRGSNKAVWEETLSQCSYIPVAYTNMSVDFLFEIQQGNGMDIYDLSVIILSDNKPVALWPLFLSVKGKEAVLNSLDNKILSPLIVNHCAIPTEKKIIKNCLQLASTVAKSTGNLGFTSFEIFTDRAGINSWHSQSMVLGATSSVEYELFVDMREPLTIIKTHFRKSFKSLINSAKRLWTVGLMDHTTGDAPWKEFIKLHAKVVGRKTRSDKSWDIHLMDIMQNQSFLIYLRNTSGEMVGAGLFNVTRDEGLYASAAYDRSLFDKPIGHLVQYHAIEELKRRGVSWYKIGIRPFASQEPKPSEKEISIGEFKQGFASHIFPRFVIQHRLANNSKGKAD